MIKQKSGAQKRKQKVVSERLQCKGQQILESFGVVGRESGRKRSCKDAPDQEIANEVLDFNQSSPGNDIEVLNVKLVSNLIQVSDASDDGCKVVIQGSILTLMKQVYAPLNIIQVLILIMELLLYEALVARLQIRTKTLTLALFSLNFHVPGKYVARFIVVIKNILKNFPSMKQASSLYHLNCFFAVKPINRQPTNSLNLVKCCLCA